MLISSLFVYKMPVLNNIIDTQIKEFNKLITLYIKGKEEKPVTFPLKVLQADKNNGGLRFTSLRHKQQALKAQ